MLTNKWILIGLQLLNAVLTAAAAIQWSTVVSPQTAGIIGIIISAGLAVLASAMPPSSQKTIAATGGTLFTHT